MRKNLKQQMLKLKKKESDDLSYQSLMNDQYDPDPEFKPSKKGSKKLKPQRQSQSQPKNKIFKNLSFCFPHIDIELTRKQVELISKQIQQQGGKVIEFGDHLYAEPVQYVLVSPKARLSSVQKKIQNKLNFIAILDYNYVQCCISEQDLIDSDGFVLQQNEREQKSQKRQEMEILKQEKLLGSGVKKKRKIEEEDEKVDEKVEMMIEQKQEKLKNSKKSQKSQNNNNNNYSQTQQLPQFLDEQKEQKDLVDKSKFFCHTGKVDKPALNKFIEKELLDLQKIYANERDIGRKIAYGKAASIIRTWKEEIITEADAEKIPGIGPKTLKKIKEIISTGKLRKLDELNQSEENVALGQLTRIWGIGPAKAKQIYKSGIKSVQELKKHQDTLTKNQKIGLKYFKDFQTRIPRQKVTKLFEYVQETLKQITKKDSELYRAQVCGSYRRGKASCGDMDVIITRKDGKFQNDLLVNLVKRLSQKKFITDNLSEPKNSEGNVATSYMGVCQLGDDTHHRIDIKHYPLESYAFAMLYFTGSGMFNRSMRLYANGLGLSLSDKGFEIRPQKKPKDAVWTKPIPTCFTEQDIFKVLGLDYKSPKERDD